MSLPKKEALEWQFDGLVGPTHNYAGLSFGNIASGKNAGLVSNPKEAAIQGLQKMRFVRDLGMPQAVLPPQKRPVISVLQRMGFGSIHSPASIAQAIEKAYYEAPHMLAAMFSSSFMWAANAGTVSPSADTDDGKMHITPANLAANFHRSLEAEQQLRLLKKIFHKEKLFSIHNFLNPTHSLADEGAANCMRMGQSPGDKSVEIFVYGAGGSEVKKTHTYPARQQRQACQAIARLHSLTKNSIIYVQQHPEAIDAGVFHNDVIAMNTTRLMIAHEKAFLHQEKFIDDLKRLSGGELIYLEIPEKELSLTETVSSYLFNSQLLDVPEKGFVLLAPGECETSNNAHAIIADLVGGNSVVSEVHYLNVRESMRNGGGPACLRLRIVLTEEEAQAMHPGIVLTDARYDALIQWVNRYYRDRLCLDDFRDPAFLVELEEAYAALEPIFELPGFYSNYQP